MRGAVSDSFVNDRGKDAISPALADGESRLSPTSARRRGKEEERLANLPREMTGSSSPRIKVVRLSLYVVPQGWEGEDENSQINKSRLNSTVQTNKQVRSRGG